MNLDDATPLLSADPVGSSGEFVLIAFEVMGGRRVQSVMKADWPDSYWPPGVGDLVNVDWVGKVKMVARPRGRGI